MIATLGKYLAALVLASSTLLSTAAETDSLMYYSVSLLGNASSGDTAPYMLGSWNYGRVTGRAGVWNDGLIKKDVNLGRRFSWGAGFEYMLGYGVATDYARWDNEAGVWGKEALRQSPARIQQLYGEIKYRGVYLLAGMKERTSGIVDGSLSSGDLVRSNNSRPIPGVAAGFVDFQDIPFTNGWVQIDGEIMYGRFTDNTFNRKQFNHYTGLLVVDLMYTYKRCYFRTKPSMPFSVTVGMQTAGLFGGEAHFYSKGKIVRSHNPGFKFKDIFDMFFPREGSGEGYYKGNSLGSWDLKLRYRFADGSRLTAYFEGPWEDGSGIGRQNGWDGLYGLQYDFAEAGWLTSALIEYIDFTNQGGPIHYAPSDNPGSTITDGVTGGDNYYNNDFYGSYTNYGMSIGSAFPLAPIYNLNGDPSFLHNRCRGFHAAVKGSPLDNLSYRLMCSYQKAGGSGRQPARHKLHSFSMMAEAAWCPAAKLPGLEVKASLGFDKGSLRGDNFGALVGIKYSGSFNFRR